MAALPLEALASETMANGWSMLVLTTQLSYDDLPAYADALAECLGGRSLPGADGPGTRLRGLRYGGELYWVAFEDWFDEITLEPRTEAAASQIGELHKRLSAMPEGD